MNDPAPRDPPYDSPAGLDHWETFAQAMDLTIEGHRLIAQEIVYELKRLWLGGVARLRELPGITLRRRSSPPV